MKNKLTVVNNPFKPLIRLLRQTNLIIFVIVVGVGVASYIFLLSNILLKAEDSVNSTNKSSNAKFDQSLIDKIETLKTSSESKTPSLPSGRINPFDE